MKLDEFNALTDEEKTNYLSSVSNQEQTISNLTAERDSFKTENDSIKSQLEANNKELKATKEMNFTLARKITAAPQTDAETTLYNFVKGK